MFASAPFIGAAGAWALGEQGGGALWWMGAGLMLAGVLLQLAESHEHEHRHEPMEHERAHTHDDGHHDGEAAPPAGPHSHPRRHGALVHRHPHLPDLHHQHRH